jgi:hypothetical protein
VFEPLFVPPVALPLVPFLDAEFVPVFVPFLDAEFVPVFVPFFD